MPACSYKFIKPQIRRNKVDYKKIPIILSGERGRSCVTLETTSYGSTLRCGLKPDENQTLYLAVRDGENVFVRKIDGKTFVLPFAPSVNAHYMVIDASSRKAVLYGTRSAKRLWHANMTDGVMKYVPKKDDFPKKENNKPENAGSKNQTVAAAKYDDEAIAQNNYYPEEYLFMPGLNRKYDNENHAAVNRTLSAMSRAYLCGENVLPQEKANGVFALQKKYVLNVEACTAPVCAANFSCAEVTAPTDETAFADKEEKKSISVKNKEALLSARRRKIVPLAADFYDEIRPKIQKLFSSAERMTVLENKMPDTKWVKVPYEKNGYYVVGIIGSRPDYVAYGLPGKNAAFPPEELGEGARWWAFDPEEEDGDGVWLLYQDARTGESVRDPF